MKILALEFSSTLRSVALAAVTGEGVVDVLAEVAEERRQGSRPLTVIQSVLTTARITPTDVDVIAVGLGPGSYAGIRSAISIAQGWQIGLAVKTMGLSSMDILAWSAAKAHLTGRWTCLIDAQRGQFYAATYELGEDKVTCVDPIRLCDLADIAGENLIASEAVAGKPNIRVVSPGASILAALAGQNQAFVPANELSPIYLRETTFVKFTGKNPLLT